MNRTALKYIVIFLLMQSFVIYFVAQFIVTWIGNTVDVFQRPFEQHKAIIRPRRHAFDFRQLKSNDYDLLVNLTNFKFTIVARDACEDDPAGVFLLILIPSAPTNEKRRYNIRTTWGNRAGDVKVVFLLGAVQDRNVQEQIEEESKVYGDIVQGNFLDSYRNLTYKSVMSLKYVIYHCPRATYILKVDDDTFVNVPLLKNFLRHDVSPFGAEDLLLCNDMTGSMAIRDNRSKWYVPEEEFDKAFYPSYCSGWYSIFSPDVCFKLYKESQNATYFYIEDVFLYGMAGGKVSGLKHVDISSHTLAYRNNRLLFNGTYDKVGILLGSPNMSIELIKKFWEYFSNKPVQNFVHKRLGN